MALADVSLYNVVLFLHIVAVVLAFGVIFAYPLFMSVARRGDERHLPYLHRVQGRIGQYLISPALAVILLAGIYLAIDGPYDFGDPWILATLVILIVIGGVGGGYLAPNEEKLAELAQRDVTRSNAEGPITMSEEYEALFARFKTASNVLALLVLVAIFLMTTKPGA
jgi:uncharacterized membrane protein